MCMSNIMIKCAGREHKKEFLSFKSRFTYPLILFLLLLLYKEEQPEIISIYDL